MGETSGARAFVQITRVLRTLSVVFELEGQRREVCLKIFSGLRNKILRTLFLDFFFSDPSLIHSHCGQALHTD